MSETLFTRPGALFRAFQLEARGQLRSWSGILVVIAVSWALIAVWASVWSMVDGNLMASTGLSWSGVIWYVAITEAVFFSVGHAWLKVEADVQTGRALSAHLRPADYLLITIAQQAGRSFVLLMVLLVSGSLFAFALSGEWLLVPTQVPVFLLSALLGSSILILIQMMVGMVVQWVGNARPVYMVVQKSTAVMGGLLVPITIFPQWVQDAIWITPFPAVFFAPASFALDHTGGHVVAVLAVQVFWLQIMIAAAALLRLAFAESLLKEGGQA